MKNRLMVTRGEGANEGKKGKGHQGTCIKDPWKSQRGVGLRVGGGHVGVREGIEENGDNCT